MQEVLARFAQLSTIAFAISTMLSLGLGLTPRQITTPLKNWRFVTAALAVNFVAVPAVALLLVAVLDLPDDLRVGLLLIACSAGAPMVPKLVQIAKGDAASAAAVVTALIVGSVIFLPIALPLLLPGADVSPVAIAVPLIWQLLLPLAAGLFVRSRYEEEAVEFRPTLLVVSNITLVLVMLTSVGQNLPGLFGLLGTGGIIAAILLVVASLAIGWVSAIPAGVERRVMALAAGQRNFAAALVVAGSDFGGRPDIITYIATAGLLMMAILIPLAGEMSRRPPGAHLREESVSSRTTHGA